MWMHLLFFGLWLLIVGFAIRNPIGNLNYLLLITLFVYGIFYLVADYRLVICEHGIIIGHFLSPRFCEVMAYQEISPRSVRQWTNCGYALSHTVYGPWHPVWYALLGSKSGFTFVGPMMDERKLKRSDRPGHPGEKHGSSMFAYRHPEKILQLMAQQVRANGLSGAEWYDKAAATPLTLTGVEDEVFAQIPSRP